ncbi:MAG TPA: serine/threonine-protein kinase, partial [Candidatus Polarisedimenticolaceae bacterium]|nr:serine/threonine-protein kinase [Candidatus Polarisedimenticolaceae bacterium]
VAVKAVSGVLAAGDALDRFEREAKLLARLNHPNIATVHDLIVVDRKPYLILELVRGTTLSELMRGGPLPPGEVRRIALELCDGLAEAHAHGIVHRDLKPANVMITPAGRVKVLDFGLAKTVERDRDGSGAFSTAASTMLGTPGYMSPEQIRGEPVDARADLWALGCILFEMLTGDRAFAGSCASDTIAAVLRDEAELGRLPADTPVELSESIRRCLDKSPERRPPSVDELRRRL